MMGAKSAEIGESVALVAQHLEERIEGLVACLLASLGHGFTHLERPAERYFDSQNGTCPAIGACAASESAFMNPSRSSSETQSCSTSPWKRTRNIFCFSLSLMLTTPSVDPTTPTP